MSSIDVFKTMDVIGSALTAEKARLGAIASNVANANSLRGADGKGPYRRKDVVLESIPMEPGFNESLKDAQATHTEVRVAEIREDTSAPKKIYNPSHPESDAEGYVSMPNVNPVEEMANMLSADRAYQMNVNLFQTTKQMALKALEMGK